MILALILVLIKEVGMNISLGAPSGGMSIGQDGSGRMRAALDGGVALRRDDGGYVALDSTGQLRDVSVFEGSEQFIYRLPVPVVDVVAGDFIVLSDAPLRVLAVEEVTKAGHVRGIDLTDSTVAEWVPPINAPMTTRLVNLANAFGGQARKSDGAGFDPGMLMLMGSTGSSNPTASDLLLLRALSAAPAMAQLTTKGTSRKDVRRNNSSSLSRGRELAFDVLSDLWAYARERGYGRPRRGKLFRGVRRPRRN